MDQQSSSSKVTVEYFDPHGVYKLLAPGLEPRFPLHNLHWQSHAGPLRSIDTLHVELVQNGEKVPSTSKTPLSRSGSTLRDDGFQTQNLGGRTDSTETRDTGPLSSKTETARRRHQIPGLRRTPYLKLLLVRCDDNDTYKSSVRFEIREWIKAHASTSVGSKKGNGQEKHDAFEWLIVHVVLPNTSAATQPRKGTKSDANTSDKSSSRWRTGSIPLMDKLRSDFNGSGKGSVDRIVQIRIGINDVPYDFLPSVVPAPPSGYTETEQDAEIAWTDLITKMKSQILASFDMRVTQYEEDIKEKDGQRSLPGWNFCTFFILKEGLARGFENVGLVDDALVGYDELSVGLDAVIQKQAELGSPESHGGAVLNHTEDLKAVTERALASSARLNEASEETVDMESNDDTRGKFDDVPISSANKAYRDMILENKVSVFDFRCYIFSRQISLLLRLANANLTSDELLEKIKEQQISLLHDVVPCAEAPENPETPRQNFEMLAEVCRRSLRFIPFVSQIMRLDMEAGLSNGCAPNQDSSSEALSLAEAEAIDNTILSFAFSLSQQILAQTSTRAFSQNNSAHKPDQRQGPRVSNSRSKLRIHPSRSSSLHGVPVSSQIPSPGIISGPGRSVSTADEEIRNIHLKAGMEELSARRADLFILSRSILEKIAGKRGWGTGYNETQAIGDADDIEFADVSLKNDVSPKDSQKALAQAETRPSIFGINNPLLCMAADNIHEFYRLYESLTNQALHFYTLAQYERAVHACRVDLAIHKFKLKDYGAASTFFSQTTTVFGADKWTLVELSLLSMHCQCLLELQSWENFVQVALQMLTKACAAKKKRLERLEKRQIGNEEHSRTLRSVNVVTEKLLDIVPTLLPNRDVLLSNYFTDLALIGHPQYRFRQDSCFLKFKFRNLLPAEINADKIVLTTSNVGGDASEELEFESQGKILVKPGKNVVELNCNSLVSGSYRVNTVKVFAGKIIFSYRSSSESETEGFLNPQIMLYQRSGALDIQLVATKHVTLGCDNCLDLTLSTGWNSLASCKIRVRPASGGLRILTREAKVVNSTVEFVEPPGAGLLVLGPVGQDAEVTLRFPYSLEQNLGDLTVKLDITYKIESGDTFFLAKSIVVPVSLALDVNVQDLFKHQALFSRFRVSTATCSPLRLYKSELSQSQAFDACFMGHPQGMITVFAKQPACLLYEIKRRASPKAEKNAVKKMYLKLYYSPLLSEVEKAISAHVAKALEQTSLCHFARTVQTAVLTETRRSLQPRDLERAALLGQIVTTFLVDAPWESYFRDFVQIKSPDGDLETTLSSFLREWQRAHPRIAISPLGIGEASVIMIPVEVPPLTVVHTADMKLHMPEPGLLGDGRVSVPTATVNQVLSATLHLKWTRIWDTGSGHKADLEFRYEVTAPSDTWLLGGRRKGHFVIPKATPSGELSSDPETEGDIPLILIPQREGWLPYPTVDIIAVSGPNSFGDSSTSCEVDWRNLGETVRVIGGRSSVTVSLDASGAGGGPLVLESEEMATGERRLIT